MKLTSTRPVLGAVALGLTLLAGCVLIPGEPTDPPPVDPPPPIDAGSPPSVDAALPGDAGSPVDAAPLPPLPPPPPPPPVPPPLSVNAPGDDYDRATNRVLIPDCDDRALLALDAATGEISALISGLPAPGSDLYGCIHSLTVEPQGGLAYGSFDYSIEDARAEDGTCSVRDLVSIDTVTGALSTLQNIWVHCDCDECRIESYRSIQVDAARDRLLYIEGGCKADDCDHDLATMPPAGGPSQRLYGLYPDWCYPDDQDCSTPRLFDPKMFAFDPVAADERMLMLATTSPEPYRPVLTSIDIATGETLETLPIQRVWGDITVEVGESDLSVDLDSWRVLVTLRAARPDGTRMWTVVLVDRYSGTQTMIYDGRPAPDGSALACRPNASLDTQANRLLLIEPRNGFQCQDNAFALDLTTGAFTRL